MFFIQNLNLLYAVAFLNLYIAQNANERSIFQTFWKPDFGTRFLFFKLGIWNFGSS